MKAVAKFENVDTIDLALTIHMKLGEWRRLAGQLKTDYPSWKLGEAIRDLIVRAETVFKAPVEPE